MANRYIKTSVVCAGPQCSKVKGTANHWFVIVPQVLARLDETANSLVTRAIYAVTPFSESILATYENSLPVCGEECLHKLTSELLRK